VQQRQQVRGARRTCTKPRLQVLLSVAFLVHFLVAGSKKLSPHSFSIILSSSVPNLAAYMRAKVVRVKAQPCRPAEKETVPLSG
jgi:hypothetical protein